MKRVLTFPFVIALVLVASVVFAATTEYFTRFSCVVPTDWYGRENSDYSVYLYSNYNSSECMWLNVDRIDNRLLEDVARDYCYNVYGRDFEQVNNSYVFTYDRDGYTWYARVADNRTQSYLTSEAYCVLAYTTATDPKDAVEVFDSIVVRESWLYGDGGSSSGGSSGGGCNSGLASLFGLLAGLALIRKKH